jgi:hypothetical protein
MLILDPWQLPCNPWRVLLLLFASQLRGFAASELLIRTNSDTIPSSIHLHFTCVS